MIKREDHPVAWAMLNYELADAHEHLGNLLKDLSEDSEYSEESFRVDLGHVYAHLNRAWYQHSIPRELSRSEWEAASEYPSDLDPVG
jgi:hypothetical protein